MALSVEQIRAASATPKIVPVHVESWGGDIEVREATVAEMREMTAKADEMEADEFNLYILRRVVVNPELNGDAAEIFDLLPVSEYRQVLNAVLVACGLSEGKEQQTE